MAVGHKVTSVKLVAILPSPELRRGASKGPTPGFVLWAIHGTGGNFGSLKQLDSLDQTLLQKILK